jgi:cobalt-zinc-cadmium efflux system protein
MGVLVNSYAAWKMSSGSSLNEQLVSWHLLEDVLGWAAVLVVSVILHFKQIDFLDPSLSIVISLYVLWNVISNLKETISVFLQAKPSQIDRQELEQKLLNVDKVSSLHSTHIWSLDGENHVFTTRVKLQYIEQFDQITETKNAMKSILKSYSFSHFTIETEIDKNSLILDN